MEVSTWRKREHGRSVALKSALAHLIKKVHVRTKWPSLRSLLNHRIVDRVRSADMLVENPRSEALGR